MDQLRAHRATTWRQRWRALVDMCRAVPRDGVRVADLAREPSRYRSQLVGQFHQALRDGISFGCQTLDAGRRQRIAQLAHLVGPCRSVDPPCPQAVRQRFAGCRVGQHGLRSGLQHRRSVPESVRLGAVPLHQGRHQAAHAAGPAWGHPCLHPHQRRQDGRRERAGHAELRGRRVLRHGSGVPGLHQAASAASIRRILRDPSQAWHECASRLLQSRGPQHRLDLRPNS